MSKLLKTLVRDVGWESLAEMSRTDSTSSICDVAFYPALNWELNNIRYLQLL